MAESVRKDLADSTRRGRADADLLHRADRPEQLGHQGGGVIRGAQSYAAFKEAIDAVLASAK